MPNSTPTLVRSFKGYIVTVTVLRDSQGVRIGRFTCKPDSSAPALSEKLMTAFNGRMALDESQDIEDVWQWAQSTVRGLLAQS